MREAFLDLGMNDRQAGINLQSETGVSVYQFNSVDVRVSKDEKGEPWFVAMDVSRILGYSDTEAMTRRLDKDEIQNRQIVGFGNRGVNIINESGLYSAIICSSKPQAKVFKKWVTSEVLPSIRKTGGYIASTPEMSDAEIMARALQLANATIQRNNEKLRETENQLMMQAPAVDYCNEVLFASNLHTVNSIAVHLGISAIRLNQFLVKQGYIYKQGQIYCPSASIRGKELCDYHVVPYFNSAGEPMTREHLKWTEAGRRFVIDAYKKNCW